MKLYRIYNTKIKNFWAGSKSKSPDKHDSHGHFYSTQFQAARAIKKANMNVADIELREYTIQLVHTFDKGFVQTLVKTVI